MFRQLTSLPGIAVLLTFTVLLPSLARAKHPVLKAVFPAGCRQGDSVEVTVSGDELKQAGQLVFSRSGVSATKVKDGVFRVEVDEQTAPGPVDVAVQTQEGLSGSLRFDISDTAEVSEQEPNELREAARIDEWPVIINGRLSDADVDWFRFDGRKGQFVLLRCRSRSIDGSVTAALTLAHGDGRELAHSPNWRPEPFLAVVLPEDDTYAVQVVDRAYRTNSRSVYRLEILAGPRVLAAFPQLLSAGQPGKISLFGYQLPEGQPAAGTAWQPAAGNAPLQQWTHTITAPAEPAMAGGGWTPVSALQLPSFSEHSDQIPDSPRLQWTAAGKVTVETEPANDQAESADRLAVPGTAVGQFQRTGDLDWLTFTAKKDETYVLEAVGDRFGLPMDLDVTILDEKGKVLATLKDLALPKDWPKHLTFTSLDARETWKAPADGTYRVLVRDLYGGSLAGPDRQWRFSIGPVQPSFTAVAVTGDGKQPMSLLLHPEPAAEDQPADDRGTEKPDAEARKKADTKDKPQTDGKQAADSRAAQAAFTSRVTVSLIRSGGFDGPVTITGRDLPAGISIAETVIAKGKTEAALQLRVAEKFTGQPSGLLKLTATAKVGDQFVSVPVQSVTLLPAEAPATARLAEGLLYSVEKPVEPPASEKTSPEKTADQEPAADSESGDGNADS